MGNIDYDKKCDDILSLINGSIRVRDRSIEKSLDLNIREVRLIFKYLEEKDYISIYDHSAGSLLDYYATIKFEGKKFLENGGFQGETRKKKDITRFENFKKRKEYISFWISIGAIVISLISLSIAIYNFTHKKQ